MPIFSILKNALFPLACRMCGRFFHVDSTGPGEHNGPVPKDLTVLFGDLMAEHLCPGCAQRFTAVESPICMRCGLVFKSRQGEDHLCGECLESEKPFGIARAAGIHDQSLMSIIHAYKYGGKVLLAEPLSKLLAAVYERHWRPASIDLVLPVPLHAARLRSRGFNQAYLLVRPWEKVVARDLLRRTRPTPPQTGLGRKSRLSNVRGAFAVDDRLSIKNKRILLVDDVYTTGATVIECARVLQKCGASKVDILTVARAVA
ncbi:MAG: ComF family protein [Deltaproteobacteria bacterium]|nr:ComF family protein [Deltaproteobacteria bacterium]